MTKRTSAKYKIDRRMGENIWGRPKSPVNKRSYGPGQHGQRRKGKMSDFGPQLRAKQKLKGYYGNLTEKQFRRIYDEAAAPRGQHLGEPDRPAGTPSGRRRLPRQVRADALRGPPVRQPRPRRGQRQARQHRLLPRQGGRRGLGARAVAPARPGARGHRLAGARRARVPRRRPLQADRRVRPRARHSPKCPTR